MFNIRGNRNSSVLVFNVQEHYNMQLKLIHWYLYFLPYEIIESGFGNCELGLHAKLLDNFFCIKNHEWM